MDPASAQQWFLRKHEDDNIFGPLPFAQLVRWAEAARIAPHDCVSTDQSTWMKAPMLAELGMDWLVEVTTERYYGPTTIGASAATETAVAMIQCVNVRCDMPTPESYASPLSGVPTEVPFHGVAW